MSLGEGKLEHLPREFRELLRNYLNQVTRLFQADLQTLLLYGSVVRPDFQVGRSNVNMLFVMSNHNTEQLTHYVAVHKQWHKERFIVPLFFTEDDLRSSRNLFPLEYHEMTSHHCLLFGPNPFEDRQPDFQFFTFQCVQEIMGNLIRLRQRYIEGAGTAEAIQVLLPLSITALLPALQGLMRDRMQVQTMSVEELLNKVGEELQLDCSAFFEAWQIKWGLVSPGELAAPLLFVRYVTALESLCLKITHWVQDVRHG